MYPRDCYTHTHPSSVAGGGNHTHTHTQLSPMWWKSHTHTHTHPAQSQVVEMTPKLVCGSRALESLSALKFFSADLNFLPGPLQLAPSPRQPNSPVVPALCAPCVLSSPSESPSRTFLSPPPNPCSRPQSSDSWTLYQPPQLVSLPIPAPSALLTQNPCPPTTGRIIFLI